jgi:hypothetical protein
MGATFLRAYKNYDFHNLYLRRIFMKKSRLLGAICAIFLINSSQAASIPGLFNTGVDETGQVLSAGSSELHYVLSGPISSAIIATPNPAWVQAPNGSAWIGPTSGGISDQAGDYTYTMTFDISTFDYSTAIITGDWSSDNMATIFVNGVNTGITRSGVSTLDTFSITEDFMPGMNTLQFFVNNGVLPGGLNPTGLLVANISGQATIVPIPPALWLFGSGLLGLIGISKRK